MNVTQDYKGPGSNEIKFWRGTKREYDMIVSENKCDENTLYFVSIVDLDTSIETINMFLGKILIKT